VLSFLSLSELAAALSVSKEWTAAVQFMRAATLPADISFDKLDALCSSLTLRRHIGQLGQINEYGRHKLLLQTDKLPALARALPQLRSLSAALDMQPGNPALLFPSQLQRLLIHVSYVPSDARDRVTLLLTAISQLQQLHTLRLQLGYNTVSLALLQQLPLLRDMELDVFSEHTVEQYAVELRALP